MNTKEVAKEKFGLPNPLRCIQCEHPMVLVPTGPLGNAFNFCENERCSRHGLLTVVGKEPLPKRDVSRR